MSPHDIPEAVARIQHLPTLPSVLGKILSTAADPEASAMDLGKHIAADQSLSATILKLVNSAYYGFYRQITSVTQAIVMLGFLEVRNLTLTATAFKTLGKSKTGYNRHQLWHHALATAVGAERAAKLLGVRIEGAFEAGLLHDLGKVVFDILYPEDFMRASEEANERECLLIETEIEIFDMTHGEAGALLAEHWNLPERVVEAIRCHHHIESATKDPTLTQLTAMANALTYEAGIGEASNGCPPPYPTAEAGRMGCTPELKAKIIEEIKKSRGRINAFLGSLSEEK